MIRLAGCSAAPRARPSRCCRRPHRSSLWSAAHPGTAWAYTVASAISTGCHERITAEALREVRLELPTAAPVAADENERALIDDVEFPLPDDMRDLGATAMLLGVRDNDLKGRQSNDISELALVHGDPNLQREHCLRSSDDDEPDGSDTALAALPRVHPRACRPGAWTGSTTPGRPIPPTERRCRSTWPFAIGSTRRCRPSTCGWDKPSTPSRTASRTRIARPTGCRSTWC